MNAGIGVAFGAALGVVTFALTGGVWIAIGAALGVAVAAVLQLWRR